MLRKWPRLNWMSVPSFSPRLSLEMSLIRISFLSTLKPVQEAIDNIDALIKGMPMPPARKAELSEISKQDKMPDAGYKMQDMRKQGKKS